MRFVIVLAFLCCCYAAEQSTSTTQQEGRQPPQHIKDFVEKHIKHDKQQQTTEGKLNDDTNKSNKSDQQAPEYIKKFIKSHISKILKYVAQQKQQRQSDVYPTLSLPPLIAEKIETLKKEVKDIIKQAEQHIPQVINQQIAYKNKLKEKQQHNDKGTNVEQHVQPHVDTTEAISKPVIQPLVKENLPSSSPVNNKHDAQTVNNQIPKQVDEEISAGQKKVQGIGNQHDVQVQKKDTTIVSNNIQNVLHPHVPNDAKDQPPVADAGQEIVEQVPQAHTEHIVIAVPSHIQRIAETNHYLLPPVTAPNQNKDVEEHSVLTGDIQNHPHVPQDIEQTDENTTKETPEIPQHIQGIVEQIHQHIPQVINQRINKVEANNGKAISLVPDHIKDIVQQIHEHVPQVIKQHAKVVENKIVKETPVLPANVQVIQQHVPEDISQQISQTANQNAQEIPIPISDRKPVEQPTHRPVPDDNVAQDHTNIVIPNEVIVHSIDTQVATSDLQSINSPAHANVHPVVEVVDKLTQHQDFKNGDNTVPSRVQQIQHEYHISPVRTA